MQRTYTGRNDTTEYEMTRMIRDEESARGGAGDICWVGGQAGKAGKGVKLAKIMHTHAHTSPCTICTCSQPCQSSNQKLLFLCLCVLAHVCMFSGLPECVCVCVRVSSVGRDLSWLPWANELHLNPAPFSSFFFFLAQFLCPWGHSWLWPGNCSAAAAILAHWERAEEPTFMSPRISIRPIDGWCRNVFACVQARD